MVEEPRRAKCLATGAFVCISTSSGLLYKVSQRGSDGFGFSTVSAIVIAECVKLVMSGCFHVCDASSKDSEHGRLQAAVRSAWSQLSLRAVLSIWTVAVMYAINHQLSFYAYTIADPGTISMFTSSALVSIALVQCSCVGRRFSVQQSEAMLLACVGMVTMQYNPSTGYARYCLSAYGILGTSTVISATSAAWNEYFVKNYEIGLHVQNMVLYAGGVVLNLIAFFVIPRFSRAQAKFGFWEGYSNDPLAIGVVLVNSTIGLAISAVYKYADAITKSIADSITAVVLTVVSSVFFGLKPSVTMWCGVLVVCCAIRNYAVAPAPAEAPAELDLPAAGSLASKAEMAMLVDK